MAKSELLSKLGIEHPIIQGPFGGGPSTPELVAAVSNAGGLGSLGAAYLTPEQIADSIAKIRLLTNRPFNVNLFAGAWEEKPQYADATPMLELLGEVHEFLGLPKPTLPVLPPDPFPAQLEAVLAEGVRIFSFTFGIPAKDDMKRLRARGVLIMGTATTADEARMLADAGADVVFAQGAEAAAHRGTFAAPFEEAMIPTLELVRWVRAVVEVPVVAAGGLMDGGDIRKALEAGASAAMLGTAFLATPESGASEAYKKALLNAKNGDARTVLTRAFSGRPARGLVNEFMRRLQGREHHILPYPLQNALTRAMRGEATKRGVADYLSLWAGTGVARTRSLPAGELVKMLVAETSDMASGAAR